MSSKYVSNDERDEVFRILRQNKVNNMCVECGSPNPQWASSTLGIFICYQCSGLHRSFGVHLTFVRSLNMDLWTPKQIEVMKVNTLLSTILYFIQNLSHFFFLRLEETKGSCSSWRTTASPKGTPPAESTRQRLLRTTER